MPVALAAHAAHGAPSQALTDALTGYDVTGVKQTLFLDQHKKCAWCERRRDFSSSPIEHFRPKDGAWRHLPSEPAHVSPGHYWWLTWTWSNLLFACARCNDRGHKANYFPLAAGTTEAPAPARPQPVGASVAALTDASTVVGEQPLLLDPAFDTFLDHVAWVPSNTTMARRLWTWSPSPLTPRGRATIAVLRLGELADELQQHLTAHVLGYVEELEQHMAGRRTKQAATTWSRLETFLEPDQPLTAGTYCALSTWIPLAQVADWGLRPLPRPS